MSSGFTAQIADDVDLGAKWQAIPELSLRLLDRGAMELSLADVLDGLVGRTARGERAGI
jgi:hypothetical protein